MRIYGLTGGIASGKSTVHGMLVDLGASVLDADAIYHRLVAPAEGIASLLARRIAERFPGVLTPSGNVDRVTLGRRVFSDPEERRALEAITHPEVAAQFGRDIEALVAQGVRRVFYDVPLLYERGLEKGMAGVVVVWVPREVQLARLIKRENIDAAAAEKRLAAQLPLDEKRARADWVVDNSGDLVQTRRQVETVWRAIQEIT